jgi:hypothetical protein
VDVALIGLGTKDIDTILAWIMFTGVALAAGLVLYLLGRHHHHRRKAKKHAHSAARAKHHKP